MTELGGPNQLDAQPEIRTFWVINGDGWQPVRCQLAPRSEIDFDPDTVLVENAEEAYGDEIPGMTLEEWNRAADRLIHRNRGLPT